MIYHIFDIEVWNLDSLVNEIENKGWYEVACPVQQGSYLGECGL